MGQVITTEMSDRIAATGKAHEVTGEHIVLLDGTVLDPKDFEIEERPIRCVLKLVRCRCWFVTHDVGTHVVTRGRSVLYGDGTRRQYWFTPAACPKGEWTCEEVLDELIRLNR